MKPQCWARLKWLIGTVIMLAIVAVPSVLRADSPPIACADVLAEYKSAVKQDRCRTVPTGKACYGNYLVTCEPATQSFRAPGGKTDIGKITWLQTNATGNNRGAAILVANTSKGQVKIYALGNTMLSPSGGAGVFTLKRTNAGDVCQRTPSGLMLQTERGQKGVTSINGVQIDLSSTAYVSVEGDLLFDQDPRIDRREGRPNPNAPLCSGFDSGTDSRCHFADCPVNDRLVWGPYCREDRHPTIRPGLYRVTLFGRGEVTAGATDYGATRQMFSMGANELSLPASYTFCWRGLQPGGAGFETIVLGRSRDARIDHLRLEYLGSDCAVAGRLASSSVEMMTVTNLEGQVTVTAVGRSYSPRPGEMVRVHFANGRPVRIDSPAPATILVKSELIQTLRTEVLPVVNAGGSGGYPGESSGGVEPPPSLPGVEISCAPAQATIDPGQCVDLRWDVEGVRAVYLDGKGVTGHEGLRVCPTSSHLYELRVVTDQGDRLCRMAVEVTSRPQPPPAEVVPSCSASPSLIRPGACTTLEWNISGVREVYLDGEGVAGVATRQVCPTSSRTFTLRIIRTDGSEVFCRMPVEVEVDRTPPTISIVNLAPLGEVCEGAPCCDTDAKVYVSVRDESPLAAVTLYEIVCVGEGDPDTPDVCGAVARPMQAEGDNIYSATIRVRYRFWVTAQDQAGNTSEVEQAEGYCKFLVR